MEGVCKHFDELAEVHTLIGDVIEYSLVAIALILHITDFHLQTEVFGNLSALYHRVMLAALGLLALVEVHLLGQSVDALDVVRRLEAGFLDLQFHKSSCQGNHANVVSWISLHGNNVTLLEVEVIHIVIISLAGILELHLHEVGALSIAWDIGKPIVSVQLSVLSAHGLAAKSTVASMPHSEFHILVVHDVI